MDSVHASRLVARTCAPSFCLISGLSWLLSRGRLDESVTSGHDCRLLVLQYNDKSLYQKIDLTGKKVQTIFLETIINKGCKELSLSGAQLEGSEFNLIEKSELRCLDLDFCSASVTNLEILTSSCVKL